MNEVSSRVLDYLGYKNKRSTADWAERLWRQHLDGEPVDIRLDEDRRRYGDLTTRLEQARSLARKLHTRRTRHAPQFQSLAGELR
ncbi:MAG: hypothetical protein QY320_13225 [Gammaproteobacteria bacterium]|nr:MAG: hypothetical protein QY320_13225 [Gammaproteobacteria bacterium]